MPSEWNLPGGPVLRLTADELSLIDWSLCMYAHVLPGDLGDYMKWESVRAVVWHSLDLLWDPALYRAKEGSVVILITLEVAAALLAILPTTHRWGTGFDCGFSLKRKLSRFLRGLTTDDNQNNAQAESASSASDES